MRNFPYDSCCVDRDLPHNYGGWYLPHIIFCGISNALLIQGGANIYNVFWIFATRLKPFKTRSPIVLSPICHHLVWYFDPPPPTHTHPPSPCGDFSQNLITSSMDPREGSHIKWSWLVKYFLRYLVDRHTDTHIQTIPVNVQPMAQNLWMATMLSSELPTKCRSHYISTTNKKLSRVRDWTPCQSWAHNRDFLNWQLQPMHSKTSDSSCSEVVMYRCI